MKKITFLLMFAIVFAFVGCNSGDGDGEDVGDSVAQSDDILVAATKTPAPTPTVVLVGDSSSVSLTEPNRPTSTPLPEPTLVPTALPPQDVLETIPDWINITSTGWERAGGEFGVVVARDLSAMPQTPYAEITKWGSMIPLSGWTAYLPDGIEERDSHATLSMGGVDWVGVFVGNDAGNYRAFYAVAPGTGGAFYSLLVYVPLTGISDPVVAFDTEAQAMNSVLNSIQMREGVN